MFDFERRRSLGIAESEVNRVSVKMKEQNGGYGEEGRGRAIEPFLPGCRVAKARSSACATFPEMRQNRRLQQYLQDAFSSWSPPVTKMAGILGREMNLSCFRLRKDQQFFLFSRRTMLRNVLKDEKDKLRKKNIIRMHAFIAIEIAIVVVIFLLMM